MQWLKEIQGFFIGAFTLTAAYFDSTMTFVFALLIAFAFNIIAGMRADEVKFKMWRLVNFKGNKFKDSLAELCWILFGTYLIKGLMDLTHLNENSVYAVQVLIWLALYFYVRNSFRNLSKAYPRVRWIRAVYYIVSFGGKEKAPKIVQDAINEVDKIDNPDIEKDNDKEKTE